MPRCRISCVFYGAYNDWSELYEFDSGTVNIANPNNLEACIDYFQFGILEKRLPLLGKEYGVRLIRASFPNSGQLGKGRPLNLPSPVTKPAGDPNITVVLACGNANNTAVKRMHMRGIWDDIEIEGGKFVGRNNAEWNGYYNSYVQALVGGGWGWWGRNATARVRITNAVEDADNFWTFTLAAPLFTVPAETVVVVRNTGIRGAERLNGPLLVRVVSATECVTVAPLAAFDYDKGGYMRWNTYILHDIATASADRMGRRDAGKKYAFYRGRQKAAPKG